MQLVVKEAFNKCKQKIKNIGEVIMNPMVITRKIDSLGRVVLPIKMRNLMRIKTGSELRLEYFINKIVLTTSDPICKLCGSEENVSDLAISLLLIALTGMDCAKVRLCSIPNVRHIFIFGITFGFRNLILKLFLRQILSYSHVVATKWHSNNTPDFVRHSAAKSLYAEWFYSVL